MSADSRAIVIARPPSRQLRMTLAWLVYLALLCGVAHLYQSRVASADVTTGNAKPIVAEVTPTAATVAETSAKAPSWIAQLDTVTKSDAPPAEICRRLREVWPSLPEDAQLEALRRIVNLLPDSDYGMVGDLAATTPLPAAAWETLATDALTRPSSTNLPVLLEVLAHGVEPARGEAKAELVSQLGADYGDDWARWKEEIQRKLTKSE